MQAPQERTVIDQAPRQHTVEVLPERERADRHSHLVVMQCLFGAVVELEVAEVSVRVEAPEITCEEIH